jgi:hypothetical protein
VSGDVFYDANADGVRAPNEAIVAQVDVALSSGSGYVRTTRTGDDGTFFFNGVPPGNYHVLVVVPVDFVATTDPGADVEVFPATPTTDIHFGLLSAQAAGLTPDGAEPSPTAPDEEQIMELAAVTALPLRFAAGRDLMSQVGTRVLGDGLVWLGVPFRSQIDGGMFQFVNCGPASLTMVLAAFGLDVGPSQVRSYLNSLIDNFDTDLGTSLDALARIGREAGLTPMDLYGDSGGYRRWSTEAVRWHIQRGHPVITLVKYRNLPGHTSSLSDFDHYIVISGLTPNGFIYNDAAFATTLGYGLEISDLELEYAWNNSSIPHHALALGLSPDRTTLSFPEQARPPREVAADAVAPARNVRRLAEADEVVRAPLLLTPALATAARGPLVGDRWSDDPDFTAPPETDDVAPMGLNLDPSQQPALEPTPGPGAIVPKLLLLGGLGWLLWAVWTFSGHLVRWRPRWRFSPRQR